MNAEAGSHPPEAVVEPDDPRMKRTTIVPAGISEPLGAYSPGLAVAVGEARLAFVSGQISIDSDGTVVGEDIETQTRFVFDGLRSVLEAAGGGLEHIVKIQIYLTDISDYPAVSAIRNEYLAISRPASTLVEVSALVLPGCRIEIDAIAAIPRA